MESFWPVHLTRPFRIISTDSIPYKVPPSCGEGAVTRLLWGGCVLCSFSQHFPGALPDDAVWSLVL